MSTSTTPIAILLAVGIINFKCVTATSTVPKTSATLSTPTTSTKLASSTNPISNSVASGGGNTRPCPDPPLIQSGIIKSRGPYKPGVSKAEYSCLSGFKLEGSSFILCVTGSVWSSLPPTCVPAKSSNIDTDVDVDVAPQSMSGWLVLLFSIPGGVIFLLLLGLLLAWFCHMSGCFHGNAVLPYMANYRQIGCCCCKKYVLNKKDQRLESTRMTSPSTVKQVGKWGNEVQGQTHVKTVTSYHNDDLDPELPNDRHDKVIYSLQEDKQEDHVVPVARKPSVWMPHANPVRNINTSTK